MYCMLQLLPGDHSRNFAWQPVQGYVMTLQITRSHFDNTSNLVCPGRVRVKIALYRGWALPKQAYLRQILSV